MALRRVLVPIAAVMVVAAWPGSPARAASCVGSGALACQPAAITRTCFWGEPAGRPDGGNALAPDTNVTYYYSRFELPAGGRVVLRGSFPRARFLSLTTYRTAGTTRGVANTSLIDTDITPDPGSQNPFRPGARRSVRHRRFTVTLSGELDPGAGTRAPNTLYAGTSGQTGDTQTVELILRIYRPDQGYDLMGGVHLPTPTASGPNAGQYFASLNSDPTQTSIGSTPGITAPFPAPAVPQLSRDAVFSNAGALPRDGLDAYYTTAADYSTVHSTLQLP
jgi:hypothetical protein